MSVSESESVRKRRKRYALPRSTYHTATDSFSSAIQQLHQLSSPLSKHRLSSPLSKHRLNLTLHPTCRRQCKAVSSAADGEHEVLTNTLRSPPSCTALGLAFTSSPPPHSGCRHLYVAASPSQSSLQLLHFLMLITFAPLTLALAFPASTLLYIRPQDTSVPSRCV